MFFNVYQILILCILYIDLIGVPPAVNNGTEGSLHHILKNPPVLNTPSSTSYTDCTYPDNDVDYGRRSDLNTSLCQCTPPGVSTHRMAEYPVHIVWIMYNTNRTYIYKSVVMLPHEIKSKELV
jgi:hypothetical protein